MSFWRCIILAKLAAAFVYTDRLDDLFLGWCLGAAAIGLAAVAWKLTADPMPTAIERGLDAYARRYRR